MNPETNTTPQTEGDQAHDNTQAPADALSRTPEEIQEEQAEAVSSASTSEASGHAADEKKVSPLKRLIRRVNIYLLLFVLITVVAGAVTVVNYLNSQKPVEQAKLTTQELTKDALEQLSNTNASIATNASQTLTIQGNAVIQGNALIRGDASIAGDIQAGGSIQGANLTIAGTAELSDTTVNSLQVTSDTAIQGKTTLRDLTVAGATSFSGSVTASQLTVSQLILSGNARLEIPNHLAFTGPSPSRSIDTSVLGGGGSASVNGSDSNGTVNINTGNSPNAGCFVRVTFNKPFNGQPHVLISPVGVGAGQTQHYAIRDSNGFSICTASAAPANKTFAFDYFVTN